MTAEQNHGVDAGVSLPPLVLLTGGASGIGLAILRALVQCGYRVLFTAHRSSAAAERICHEYAGQFPETRVEFVPCDLADPEGVAALIAELSVKGDSLYGFVHNAGVSCDGLSAVIDLAAARRAMQVNFWSYVQICATVVPIMRRNHRGRIVAVSSIAAGLGMKGNGVYSSTKAALEAYSRALVTEVSNRNITVNCVAPGYIDSDMLGAYSELRASITERIPLARYGDAAQVAALVRFLLSQEAGYVSGESIRMDGGLTACLPR